MAKKSTMMYRLLSSAGTGFYYVGKNSKNAARKMTLMKYYPIVNQYVLFNEMKLKSGRK